MAPMFLPYTTDLVTALGWTILHSLWQALVVFACLRIVLKLWPGATASTKYNLSFLSLAGIFGWFVVTLYQQLDAMKQLHAAPSLLITGNGANAMIIDMPVVYQNQQELTGMFPSLEICFPVLVGLYVAGVGVMCIKLVADLAQLQQIRKKQVLPVDPAWEQYLMKLAQQLHVPARVKLLISQHIQVPVMMGFLKPIILLPIAMFNNLSAEQLEAILLHELAHVKRNDYILNIFQSIVETALFFNPFVWWISKYIRLEREHCCDDMVIAHTAQPLHYAKALVVLEEYRFTNNPMAMAAADNKQHLFYRIKRIMEMKTSHLNYSQKFMAVVIIATGLTAIAWITPSAKQGNAGIATEETAAPSLVAINAAAPQPAPSANPSPLDTVPPDTTPAAQPSGDKFENKEADPGTATQDDKYTDEEKSSQDQWKSADQDQWKSMKEAQKQAKVAQEAAQKAMKEAMKNIDWKAINEQTAKALKAVDWNQINKEISASMKAIDWNQINKDVENGLKESKNQVDPEMIRQSVEMGLKSAQTALANIDIQNIIQQSMMQAQRGLNGEEREAMRKDMVKAREEQRKAMAETRDQIRIAQKQARDAQQEAMAQARDKARESATQARDAQRKVEEQSRASNDKYQRLIKQLQEDKLIEAGKPFTIEKKNNDLYINGTKQPAAIMDKYRSYLDGKTITIKGGNDNLDVNVNN
ncbi:M48 family metalloprotease [Chitinophaga agrisoli]|uniref:M48 family metalloprotease n=1 Tax=Chitinophaga agrisoli TaxID=2607653 RepID=A0A5B2VKN1_9BACT|nr:M56 family metallopeptidase [Chitinophaga agrisoli]KAA2239641.1 M48 family metalloprotease [Chitinophaga agrisoli]